MQAGLEGLLGQMEAYEAAYGSGGGAPAGDWSALVGAVQGAAASLSSVTSGVAPTDAVFSLVGGL